MTTENTTPDVTAGAPAPATTPAPAPAPAAPAAAPAPTLPVTAKTPAAPPTPAPDASKGVEAVAYDTTGDAGLDVALGFVGRLGIGPDSPEMKAATQGDFSLLKALLATRDDAKGFEHFVALGENAFKAFAEKEHKKSADVRATAVSVAGSEEAWAAVEDWVTTNGSPEEKKEIVAGLNQGGVVARALAEHLVNLHSNAVGVTKEPADALSGNAQAAPTNTGRIGKEEYRNEVRKLASGGGTAEQYAALEKRFDPRLK